MLTCCDLERLALGCDSDSWYSGERRVDLLLLDIAAADIDHLFLNSDVLVSFAMPCAQWRSVADEIMVRYSRSLHMLVEQSWQCAFKRDSLVCGVSGGLMIRPGRAKRLSDMTEKRRLAKRTTTTKEHASIF